MAERKDLAGGAGLDAEIDALLDVAPESDPSAGPIYDAERIEPEADLGADVCRHLRCKMFYVKGRDGCDLTTASTTAQYICLRSQQVLGPDDRPVGPGQCARARRCFEEL
jgi:hypothetical protein